MIAEDVSLLPDRAQGNQKTPERKGLSSVFRPTGGGNRERPRERERQRQKGRKEGKEEMGRRVRKGEGQRGSEEGSETETHLEGEGETVRRGLLSSEPCYASWIEKRKNVSVTLWNNH